MYPLYLIIYFDKKVALQKSFPFPISKLLLCKKHRKAKEAFHSISVFFLPPRLTCAS
jgi:hypothetical protein